MPENKTKTTEVDVSAFLDAIPDPVQREDSKTISAMMQLLSGKPAKMWGPSMVGFGTYHYKYESGREGEMFRIGFAPRKGNTVLYIHGCEGGVETKAARLGKVKTGKSCIYIKRLSDIDQTALEELCAESLTWMKDRYPDETA